MKNNLDFSIFENLKAEEEAFLHEFFIPPRNFSRILEDRSIIVFGKPGSGKTALYRMVRKYAKEIRKNKVLLVEWRPSFLIMQNTNDYSCLLGYINHVFEAISFSTIDWILTQPDIFKESPDWAQKRITVFFKKFIHSNLTLKSGPMVNCKNSLLLHEMLSCLEDEKGNDPSIVFTDPNQEVNDFLVGLSGIGIESVWILIDGLEGWASFNNAQLFENLRLFLSTLTLFERSNLVFKFFLPNQMESFLVRASGIVRRRIEKFQITWETDQLIELVEKRLAYISNSEIKTFSDLVNSDKYIEWFERASGNIPREWLDQVYPLVFHYFTQSLSCPIAEEVWKNIRYDHPPRFSISEVNGTVSVGGREISIEKLPSKAYDILDFLSKKSGEVISKEELYYIPYCGLRKIPRSPQDKYYESPNEYLGIIDTTIYRLRQELEPDPSNPVIIQTVRGHGIRFVNRW